MNTLFFAFVVDDKNKDADGEIEDDHHCCSSHEYNNPYDVVQLLDLDDEHDDDY